MNIDSASGMAEAKAWLQSVIRLLNDGAIFVIPRSCTQIRVYHSQKVAEFETYLGLIRERETVRVFQALGWHIQVGQQLEAKKHQLVLTA